jgi:hypothetical protein
MVIALISCRFYSADREKKNEINSNFAAPKWRCSLISGTGGKFIAPFVAILSFQGYSGHVKFRSGGSSLTEDNSLVSK